MRQKSALLAFNRGIISRYGLGRLDLERAALSAEVMTNWMPRVLGSMMLRPGLQYIGATASHNVSKSIPFVFSLSDLARIELTDDLMRVWVDDALVTRAAVTAAITNGTFDANINSWTDNDEGAAASTWLTGGYMALLGTGSSAAIRDQTITVNEAGTQHALRIVIQRGPVTLRVGSTSGGDEYISEVALGTGTHSLTLTPTANFYIRLMSREAYTVLVDSVAIEAAGTMTLAAPWQGADLGLIRYEQSGDVVYVFCSGYQTRKIERRTGGSWSVVHYAPVDGPFRTINPGSVTIAASAISGDVTLTASSALFRSTQVGALFRLQSSGQTVTSSISAQNTFSNYIRVTGIGTQRAFSVFVSGTFVANVTLQYSIAEPGAWVDTTSVYTMPTTIGVSDGLDNQIIYYRIGIKTGGYTSGTADVSLVYGQGSINGVARVTAYTSTTVVSAVVLSDFGSVEATSDWWEGSWSDYRGWPSAGCLYEGRLWLAGNDRIYGSISDDFEGFDDAEEGDSGPISRSIGEGPVDNINWLLPLGRLIIGTESVSNSVSAVRIEAGGALTARSNSFDEPLTPTNFNMKYSSTMGIYVSRSGSKLLQSTYDVQINDYQAADVSLMVPDLVEEGIIALAAQKEPDTRVHCVLDGGGVAILITDPLEEIKCWVKFETDGEVEDVCVLPGTEEDQVYYTVKRTVGGSTKRFHEKWALQSECRGGELNKQADSFILYSGASTTVITGLDHLNGLEVTVWGTVVETIDAELVNVGKYLGEYTVLLGQITLSTAVVGAIVGLAYEARFKSAKQAIQSALGSPNNEIRKINQIGLILLDTHKDGLYYGPDFTTMDPLPAVEDGATVDDDYVWESYDKDMFTFPGEWTTDSRVCLKATAPKPCTISAVTTSVES